MKNEGPKTPPLPPELTVQDVAAILSGTGHVDTRRDSPFHAMAGHAESRSRPAGAGPGAKSPLPVVAMQMV